KRTLLDTGEDRRTLTKAGNEHLLDTEGSHVRTFQRAVERYVVEFRFSPASK
ncbi:hypothetical protein EV644_1672, partial [Kribbella orskensis]